ncbi:DUF1573 domain-containing protein [Winogradskyella psychrotolerans]|uniref:DUF1573 domain-containing protein n=1 Tax=Winogradskyella psychrotolerans TaxID=1344585 RepID=UPI001C076F81|nr:DUF1573 domain-containing protein [Winogradskyella psychrotolerans]MBU2922190.1 DUF1573 domain-containing protein [Winogradskyella psychrotolerans]
MKRTLNISILLIFALSFFNAAPTEFDKYDVKVAILKFKTEVINYGTITQNAEGKRIFTFTNTGDAPLLITKVKTSCGCTVPSYSKAPIQPGDQGELEIKYNTKRLGAFTKTVTVISNAKGGNKILKIKGNIVASK